MYEKLITENRSVEKSASVKALRKSGFVPGVIYGKETESLPIKVPANKLHKFLEGSGRVFEVEVAGGGTHLVNLDNIQWDHLGNHALHVAFHKLKAGQKTRVTLPIHWIGESKGHRLEGGVIHQAYNEIEIEGLPKDIPDSIEVDITELGINEAIHLSDLTPPKNCKWMEDESIVLVSCQPPRAEKIEEPVSPEETPTLAEEEGAEQAQAADSHEGEEKGEKEVS